jgi:hypothetical protein
MAEMKRGANVTIFACSSLGGLYTVLKMNLTLFGALWADEATSIRNGVLYPHAPHGRESLHYLTLFISRNA